MLLIHIKDRLSDKSSANWNFPQNLWNTPNGSDKRIKLPKLVCQENKITRLILTGHRKFNYFAILVMKLFSASKFSFLSLQMWIYSLGRTLMKTMPTILPAGASEHSIQQQHHSSIVLQATIWKMCKCVEERASLMFLLNVSAKRGMSAYSRRL